MEGSSCSLQVRSTKGEGGVSDYAKKAAERLRPRGGDVIFGRPPRITAPYLFRTVLGAQNIELYTCIPNKFLKPTKDERNSYMDGSVTISYCTWNCLYYTFYTPR